MQYFLEGIVFGLFLAFSMGPIFIVLTQSSIQKGWKAGTAVGLGIWFSDIVYITCCYIFVQSIASTLANETFKFWASITGGVILIFYGLYLMFSKSEVGQETIRLNAKNFAQYFSKGFLINTLNPFTPIFWLGVTSTYLITREITFNESLIVMGAIMLCIIGSDLVKVFLAQMIRTKLTQKHMSFISKIAGSSLLLIGAYIFYTLI